jgi:2-dehydro-3-deoxyphosphogluconate aldolase/(4S)-4-hydroxy-2-oxoglutarate aldolase
MDRKKKVLNLIVEQGLVPVYYHPDAEVSLQVLKALYNAGFRAVEYANQGEAALKNFLSLRKAVDTELDGLQLGAGTIKNKIEATEFVNEGAEFILSPGVVEEVATLVHKNDLLWVPTCMTTTEILRAEDLDALLVNLFPASVLGPDYVTAIKEIFPDLYFMQSGGIEMNEETLSGWINAGVSAVGLGRKLISPDWLQTRDYMAIEFVGREVLAVMKKIQST